MDGGGRRWKEVEGGGRRWKEVEGRSQVPASDTPLTPAPHKNDAPSPFEGLRRLWRRPGRERVFGVFSSLKVGIHRR